MGSGVLSLLFWVFFAHLSCRCVLGTRGVLFRVSSGFSFLLCQRVLSSHLFSFFLSRDFSVFLVAIGGCFEVAVLCFLFWFGFLLLVSDFSWAAFFVLVGLVCFSRFLFILSMGAVYSLARRLVGGSFEDLAVCNWGLGRRFGFSRCADLFLFAGLCCAQFNFLVSLVIFVSGFLNLFLFLAFKLSLICGSSLRVT